MRAQFGSQKILLFPGHMGARVSLIFLNKGYPQNKPWLYTHLDPRQCLPLGASRGNVCPAGSVWEAGAWEISGDRGQPTRKEWQRWGASALEAKGDAKLVAHLRWPRNEKREPRNGIVSMSYYTLRASTHTVGSSGC